MDICIADSDGMQLRELHGAEALRKGRGKESTVGNRSMVVAGRGHRKPSGI